MPTIRALLRSLCFFEGNEAPCPVSTPAGNLPNHLFRRSANSIPKQTTVIRGPVNSSLAVHISGVPDQPAQERNPTNPDHLVPWVCNRLSSDDSGPPIPQGESNPKGSILASDTGNSTNQDIGTSDWNTGGHQASNTTSPTPLSRSSGFEDSDPALPPGILQHLGPPVPVGAKRSPVVGNTVAHHWRSTQWWETQLPTTQWATQCWACVAPCVAHIGDQWVGNTVAHPLLHQYCEDRGLYRDRTDASKSGWGAISQGVSTGDKWTPVEAESHINYLELMAAFLAVVFHQRFEQYWSAGTDGQSDSDSPYEQDGRTNPVPTMSPSFRNLGMLPSPQHHSTCRVFTWGRQCQCRLGILPLCGQQRLAALALCVSVAQQSVGSIQHRPFCQQDQNSVAMILQLETGPSSHSSGRLLGTMDSRSAISFPTIQSDWWSTEQNSARGSDKCMPCRPSMASTSLVSPAVEYVDEQPNTPTVDSGSPHESNRPVAYPLVMEG